MYNICNILTDNTLNMRGDDCTDLTQPLSRIILCVLVGKIRAFFVHPHQLLHSWRESKVLYQKQNNQKQNQAPLLIKKKTLNSKMFYELLKREEKKQ